MIHTKQWKWHKENENWEVRKSLIEKKKEYNNKEKIIKVDERKSLLMVVDLRNIKEFILFSLLIFLFTFFVIFISFFFFFFFFTRYNLISLSCVVFLCLFFI